MPNYSSSPPEPAMYNKPRIMQDSGYLSGFEDARMAILILLTTRLYLFILADKQQFNSFE